MRLRLAGGVVAAPGQTAWASRPTARPAGAPLAGEGDAPPGAAVALGPADAGDDDVERALTELNRLVVDGGVVAAGAGVELGGGFRSARLAGARGDQRDAVLAALRVLGVAGAGRLGDRAGFLVALFGPSVTRRVGAAAARAMAEGRWSALHLAAAASDVLGPEQLERVLALDEPGPGADLIGGAQPSVLAANLRRVLEPVTAPRRLELVTDLWARVAEHHAGLARRERLLATQGRKDRLDDLRERRRHHEDHQIVLLLRSTFNDGEPSLAAAARWSPPDFYWYGVLNRILKDAFAATALLHTVVAVSDHGMEEGLARSAALIRAADSEMGEVVATTAARKVPGLTGLPASPGVYVRDIRRKMDGAQRRDAPRPPDYIKQRLARARDYALLTIETIRELFDGSSDVPEHVLREWASTDLRRWRDQVGYSSVRPPSEWADVPTWTHFAFGPRESLAARLEGLDDPVVAEVEEAGDLLWCADLVDALALLHGHEAAELKPEVGAPWLDHDPAPDTTAPLSPRYDSIASAVSGTAQLVALGGAAKKGVRTWAGFVEGLLADAGIAEALDGRFTVPEPLAAVDGTIVPGTGGARFRLARSARTLAEWSNYMGNCIAGPFYVRQATAGRCGLAALYDKDDRVLLNAELIPVRPGDRGWQVSEIAARFNESPDQALESRFRAWVGTVPGTGTPPDAVAGVSVPDETPARPGRSSRRAPRPRLLQDAGPTLGRLAERAWSGQVAGEPARILTALADPPSPGAPHPDAAPEAALTRLRRLGAVPLANACRNALARGALDLADLWALSAIRPLETALDGLDPALRHRFERLTLLTGAASLPASLRKLARTPQIAPAYSMGLVALRVRAAIGRLVLDGDPVVARSVTRRTTAPMLCALTVHVTCAAPPIDLAPVAAPRAVTVPGFPASTLNDEDGPWQRALPEARELGADTGVFWERIAEHGLRVPAAWLTGGGGWPVLWSRAHHPRRT